MIKQISGNRNLYGICSSGTKSGPKCNMVEKKKEKETDKSVVHLMKKILKGRKASGGTIHNASADKKHKILKGRKASGGTIHNASADKKHKILHMFHIKVHPERIPKSQNQSKYATNGTYVNEDGYKKVNQTLSGEDITIFPDRDISKKSANNTRSNMPQPTCGASDSTGNRECWIKSDAEYLVLEL